MCRRRHFMDKIPSSFTKMFIFEDKLVVYRLKSMLKSVITEEVSFKTKIEIIRNKLSSTRPIRVIKIHETGTKGKQIYYKKQVLEILWFELGIKLYFVNNCNFFFILRRYENALVKVLKPVNDRQSQMPLKSWENLRSPHYYMSMKNY